MRLAVADGDWLAPIFNDQELFPRCALALLKNQKIEVGPFATILFYWSILQHHPKSDVQVVRLSDDGAQDLLKETFKPTPKFRNQSAVYYGTGNSYFSEYEQKQFFKELEALPLSEQCFFVIPDIQQDEKFQEEKVADDDQTITISQSLRIISGINVFNRCIYQNKKMRMVPSFGMMQTFIKAAGKGKGVTLNPVIGLATLDDIRRNGISNTREMTLPFPGVEIPKEADYNRCPELYDFIYHDFYHALLASFVPPNHRAAFMAVENVLRVAEDFFEGDLPFINLVCERIIDMECVLYRPGLRNKATDHINRIDSIFWISLQTSILDAATVETDGVIRASCLEKMFLKILSEINWKEFDIELNTLRFLGRMSEKGSLELEEKELLIYAKDVLECFQLNGRMGSSSFNR